MSETNDTTKRPGKTLSLKKTEMSTVKQSFSHGRTKAVVVEKKRSTHPTPAAKAPADKAKPSADAKAAPTAAAAPARDVRPGVVLRQLTDEEKARRGAALADARVYEDEARKRAEEDARRRTDEDSKLTQERAKTATRRKAEEDTRKAAEELAKRHAEEEATRFVSTRRDVPASKTATTTEAARRNRPCQRGRRRGAKKRHRQGASEGSRCPQGRGRSPPRKAHRHARSVR